MLSSGRKNDIREVVKKISYASEKFQLTHATYACTSLIQEDVFKKYREKCDKINRDIEDVGLGGGKTNREEKKLKELLKIIEEDMLHIDVDYISAETEEARIIKATGRYIISISRELSDDVYNDDDDSINYDTVQKIREKMAHELGHAILHTKHLLKGTQGTAGIKDSDKEAEANFFAEELLKVRDERHKRLLAMGDPTKF